MTHEHGKVSFVEWWGEDQDEGVPEALPERISPERSAQAKPPSWYNQEYFAAKSLGEWTSNYKNLPPGGYTWDNLAYNFQRTAAMLMRLFPEAKTWLDVGCARGYLVRAVREVGGDAYGIDHSPWCIANADPHVQGYCFEVPLEEMPATWAGFDILTAFETFEHCDGRQIHLGLRALRTICRQGIFATIPNSDMRHTQAWSEAQDERSHVTLESRAWWHEQFLSAGWVHTPFHAMAEAYVESIWLVRNSGWSVFLYSPGAI